MTHLTKQQLTNDLLASKMRERALMDTNQNLRKDHALQSQALVAVMRERDDWREAFKTVSRLVK